MAGIRKGLTMRLRGIGLIACACLGNAAAHAADATERFYYRNVQTPSAPGNPVANPGPSGNEGPGSPAAPSQPVARSLAASGQPQGRTTVGDEVSMSFVPAGFGKDVTFAQVGPDVPGLVFSRDTGTLSGTLSMPGQWSFKATATDAGGTASAVAAFSTVYYPPVIALSQPGATAFGGIPFTLRASPTNGAVVTQWSATADGTASVDPDGLVTVKAPANATQVSVQAVGKDAWDQSGSATRSVALTLPTASVSGLPARLRSGQPYGATLASNLPSPSWSASVSRGGTASVSGGTLTVVPDAANGTSLALTATATSSDAAASATASSEIVPPLAAGPVSAMTALRGSGVQSFQPPSPTGKLGELTYTLSSGGDVSDTLGTTCPGFAFSRQTGVISGTVGFTKDCSIQVTYGITDPGDGTAPPATVSSSPVTFSTRSNMTFAYQPANISTQQLASGQTVSQLAQDNSYVTPFTWKLTDGTSTTDIRPSWITTSCPVSLTTCSVTASPTASTPVGTYGPYAIAVSDKFGYLKQSATFTVQVDAAATAADTKPVSASGVYVSYSGPDLFRSALDGNSPTNVVFNTAGSYVQFEYPKPVTADDVYVWLGSYCGVCTTNETFMIQALLSGGWVNVGTFQLSQTSTYGQPNQYNYGGKYYDFSSARTATKWRFVPTSYNSGISTQALGSVLLTYGGLGKWQPVN